MFDPQPHVDQPLHDGDRVFLSAFAGYSRFEPHPLVNTARKLAARTHAFFSGDVGTVECAHSRSTAWSLWIALFALKMVATQNGYPLPAKTHTDDTTAVSCFRVSLALLGSK